MEPYFQKALSDMVFENACGASIRRMVDRGCTSMQIFKALDFPIAYERVKKAVTEYLLETGILRKEPPGGSSTKERYTYVQEKGKFGKVSFRKVPLENGPEEVVWQEFAIGDFAIWKAQGEGNKTGNKVYVPCDFGLPEKISGLDLSVLNEGQREFLEGICWEKKRMYYRLDVRMEEIMRKLYGEKFEGII